MDRGVQAVKYSLEQKLKIMGMANYYSNIAVHYGDEAMQAAISADLHIPPETFCGITLLAEIYADVKLGRAERAEALTRQRALWDLITIADDLYDDDVRLVQVREMRNEE